MVLFVLAAEENNCDMASASPSSADPDERAANRARFELELEFVQALANPFYLHSLAQQNILEQPAFINYLKYLLYFKEKDYARFIQLSASLVHCHLARLTLSSVILMLSINSRHSNTRNSVRS